MTQIELHWLKYPGTKCFGRDFFDSISKEEFATIAFYLASRIHDGMEKDVIREEFQTLVENGILKAKKI